MKLSIVVLGATRSVTRGQCSIPKRSTQSGSSSFSSVAMSQWNALPTELILCSNPLSFSCLSKCLLLNKQTCTHLWCMFERVCVCVCVWLLEEDQGEVGWTAYMYMYVCVCVLVGQVLNFVSTYFTHIFMSFSFMSSIRIVSFLSYNTVVLLCHKIKLTRSFVTL